GGACPRLEAPVAPLRRAHRTGSTGQVERPYAAALEHVSPLADRLSPLNRPRYRRTGEGVDRGGVPGTRLLGRVVHLSFLQPSHAGDYPVVAAVPVSAAGRGACRRAARWLPGRDVPVAK